MKMKKKLDHLLTGNYIESLTSHLSYAKVRNSIICLLIWY